MNYMYVHEVDTYLPPILNNSQWNLMRYMFLNKIISSLTSINIVLVSVDFLVLNRRSWKVPCRGNHLPAGFADMLRHNPLLPPYTYVYRCHHFHVRHTQNSIRKPLSSLSPIHIDTLFCIQFWNREKLLSFLSILCWKFLQCGSTEEMKGAIS